MEDRTSEIQKRIKSNVRKKRRAKRRAKNKHHYRRTHKLKRIHFGWWKRRFNIMLDPLKPFERKVLLENPLLKYSADDDQFVLILFKIYDMQRSVKSINKQYINHYGKNFTTFKEIKRDAKRINWECAICKDKIKSEMNCFDVDNFLCDKCKETHSKGQFIDDRILHSSIKFRKACEFLYKHQQETYKNFVRKSEQDNR